MLENKTPSLETLLQELLIKPEGPNLDFKKVDYSLSDKDAKKKSAAKADFIKDVLAMANTPRDCDAYIVLGVERHSNGNNTLHGLAQVRDDNEYQSVLSAAALPIPAILFSPINLDGRSYGLITIRFERRGPYCSKSDMKVDAELRVRQNVIYFRNGSTNQEANSEMQRNIHRWFASIEERPTLSNIGPSVPWEEFWKHVHSFESDRCYILLTGPIFMESPERLSGLSQAPWTLIVDMDNRSTETGLSHALLDRMRSQRAIHEVVLGDSPTLHMERSTYWYYAAGRKELPDTLAKPGWRAWKHKYGNDLSKQIGHLAEVWGGRPVTIVTICDRHWEQECGESLANYVEDIFSAAENVFGDKVDYLLALSGINPDSLSIRSVNRYAPSIVSIEAAHISDGLVTHYNGSGEKDLTKISFPTRGGTNFLVPNTERRWLEEELELVGLEAGLSDDISHDTGRDFLRGSQITWYELSLHYDIVRDKVSSQLADQVRYDIGEGTSQTSATSMGHSRSTTRINVYHEPGAGGTTLARRILWDLHEKYPCVVLRSCTPAETVDRLGYIFQNTNKPLLVLIEMSHILERQTEELYSLIRVRQISAVLLQVSRRSSAKEISESSRARFLKNALSEEEANRLVHKLIDKVPHRRSRLEPLIKKPENRYAFYLGLEAFEENFVGLTRYVQARLETGSDVQKRILLFLSLAYYYGHKEVPTWAFAEIVGVPNRQRFLLEKSLTEAQIHLLRREGADGWRPVHSLVAIEIIRQILSPARVDSRAWKNNLSEWAIAFIKFCRNDSPVAAQEMVELVARAVYLRDSATPVDYHNRFSRLIDDIPNEEGRQRVLEALTEFFPEQAHFWGQLGRFYWMVKLDSQKSIQAIDNGIKLSPEDPVLYHIKGMALRAEVYELIERSEKLSSILERAKLAAEQFIIAREKAPVDEYGYISHVQMLLKIIDYAMRSSGVRTVTAMLVSPDIPSEVREALDTAEDLLEQIRRSREGERQSRFMEECGVKINELYGDYKALLQGWDNLLERKDVYRPPVRRQLVRAYLVRKNRVWDKLSRSEIQRIIALLEENLLEEPHEERNIRMWLDAVRHQEPSLSLDRVIERVSYWKSNTQSVDAAFYLYALYTVAALEGSTLAAQRARSALDDSRQLARLRRNRVTSFEWLGKGQGLRRLVHRSDLDTWDDERDFWGNTERLVRIEGMIRWIGGPEKGELATSTGLSAFFVPGKSGHSSKDINRVVTFYLGFSYDGLRAWEVESKSGLPS